jgi:hypothetical protein
MKPARHVELAWNSGFADHEVREFIEKEIAHGPRIRE